MKFLTDITITIFILPILLVVIPIIYFSILISDGSPAIYKQERVRKNNKKFIMYKFRTLEKNAEKKSGPIYIFLKVYSQNNIIRMLILE